MIPSDPLSPNLMPCSICGTPTEYRCADCAIGVFQHTHPPMTKREIVAVCGKTECRDAHETERRCRP